MIPAGILNKDVELFADGERLMAIHDRKIVPFRRLPFRILKAFMLDMLSNKKAMVCLIRMGIISPGSMLEKYCWCRFGAFDKNPDFSNGDQNFIYEFWDCGHRHDCPYQFVLCDRVWFGDTYLTKKQVEIVQLIATGKPDKQICDMAGITIQTLYSHKKNIYNKLNMHSQVEIAAFAFKNNLTS